MSQNYKNLNKIGFFGNLMGAGVDHGYGYTAVELIKAWQALNIPVWWAEDTCEIGFHFSQPHFYDQFNKINIGYTPWESTGIPEAWPYYINKMHELWTTSTACKEWFEACGAIEVPIRVLPHGVNPEHYPLKKREWRDDEPFKFLHIGEPTPRKGGKLVYETFKKLYGNRDDILLVIKGEPSFDTRELSNVFVIKERLPQSEMTKLYLKCHAMIYPGNGEGFGLIPFQAIATGMPTAVTNWGGHLDYNDCFWKIKVKDLIEADYEPHEGLWALPDESDVEQCMLEFVDNYNDCFDIAAADGEYLQYKFSWEKIAKLSLDWLEEILENCGG